MFLWCTVKWKRKFFCTLFATLPKRSWQQTCICVCMCVYICMYVFLCMHCILWPHDGWLLNETCSCHTKHNCTYINVYIHTYIDTHTHIHMPTFHGPASVTNNRMWNKSWIHKHTRVDLYEPAVEYQTTPNILYAVCASGGGAGRFCCKMSLMFLFCNEEMDVQFLKDVGPIYSKVRCNVLLWYVLATAFQTGSWCGWCLHCPSWRLHCGVLHEVRNITV